ncbi:thioredoxin [Mycobacterium sp. ITM-2016-00317]|uniref:thioredoxin n=1 Tax=Mycobacterium sp. ITM-2016-00317 TaxID=2099694 RepID=UPI00287F73B4|nr:thioredoxin [Mycobacterium sp. ITM-2016-00317]WNG87586.1 thioredoxin [Mycobacterium sp. ITM-2016-00317]
MTTTNVKCPHCTTVNRIPAAANGTPGCARCHEPLPWIAVAGDADFAEVAERSKVPVLVDLWAAWCGPCQTVGPALEQLATEHAGELKVVKVDVDTARRTAARFSVQSVPTLLVLADGSVLARQAGAAPVACLRAWLDRALSGAGSTSGPAHR